MACVIHTDKYSDKLLNKIQNDLTVRIENNNKSYGTGQVKMVQMYVVREEMSGRPCNIPFAYGLTLPKQTDQVKAYRPMRKYLGSIVHNFVGSLREEQRECRDKALSLLQTEKTAILSCYTGFGKTVTAINMAGKIKLRTLIVVPKKTLLQQWADEVALFLPTARVLVIEPSSIKKLDPSNIADVCIVNGCNVRKVAPEFLAQFGFVIVDEAHLHMTERGSENLLHLTPRYLLGVTATPYREDGYNALFRLFFGEHVVKYALNKHHVVYKVKTGFVPDEKKYLKVGPNFKSKLDWNGMLNEQAKNEPRNQLIVDIVRKFSDRVFLILVKRVEHGQLLLESLEQLGEKVTSLLGKQQEFDRDARILVGTNSKIGTGFNHPKLDTLLCACDMVSYYVQFLGRVMRRKDVKPIVFDLVDSHPTLKKHFEKRLKVYNKHGGDVVKFTL
jgi:superfamily II DNA or RNA helicase